MPPVGIGIGIGFGGTLAWTPRRLSPYFWLDPSYGVALNGATVSSWTDRMGVLTVTQGTALNQPTFTASAINGRPGLTFTGSHWLTVAAGTLTATGYSIAAVVMHSSIGAGGGYTFSDGAPGANGFGIGTIQTRKRELVHYGIVVYDSTALLTLSAPELQLVTYTAGAAPAMRVNGSPQTLSSGLTTYTASAGPTFIGAQSAAGAWTTGVICEIVGKRSVWSAAEIASLERYFQTKYALW